MKRTVTFFAWGLAAALSTAFSCGRGDEHPNIVLVTLDTTRRDFLEPYDPEASTPAIAAVARAGAVFDNVYAPMTVTRPSHATMFTGLYPRTHGVLNNTYLLGDEAPVIAERFRDAGYRTIAHVSTGLFQQKSGFLRGFTVTDPDGEKAPDATVAVDRALASLSEVGETGDRAPFFLWLHLFDAHFPYTPPARYMPAGEWSRRVPLVDHDALRAESEPRNGDVSRGFYEHARAMYAAEIAHMDDAIGRLDAWLEESGLRGNTLFVIVADHGEGFEQGIFFAHAPMITEPGIAVPLIVRGPGIAPARHDGLAGLTDLAPTLLELAGLDSIAGVQGRSLASVLKGIESEPAGGSSSAGASSSAGDLSAGALPAVYFAYGAPITDDVLEERERRARKNEIRSQAFATVTGEPRTDLDPYVFHDGIVADGWKLVLRDRQPHALYDLAADPDTRRNRIRSEPARARDLAILHRELLARIPESGGEPPPVLTEEEAARLRALGYMD